LERVCTAHAGHTHTFGKNWAAMGNLTILTNCKLFSGLTPTAAKCPSFPTAKTLGAIPPYTQNY